MSFDDTESAVTGASTVVSLTFDDTFADHDNVGQLANARGLHLTFFVNSTRFDRAGYMTLSQTLALQQQGHEIAGHTLTHPNLTTLADADARYEICNDRVALLGDGFAVTSFAYPFGANNATVEQIVADCGYNSARDVGGLVTPNGCVGCPYANAIPPRELYALRTSDSANNTTTLATLQQYVTQAENTGGGFVPIVFHHVCDGCSSDAVSIATFTAFLDWLAARGPATQVATVTEVIGGSVKPGVTAPPPTTEPPPASNLLRNPSLETDANRDQVPDCWQRGGFGTNSATYALVSDAYDGAVAQQITMTSFSSGGRRLISSQDSGTCAPAVIAGHRYTMTAMYKATVQPIFSVYYRNTSGAWVWFAQSAALPASTTYRQATYTTPALPADATAISVGLTITAVGTLTSDAYTLVDIDATPPPPTDTTPPTLSIACNGAACSTQAYASAVTVSLTAADSGSGVQEIRYTTDGSDPTTGTIYTAPFTIAATATVRATAVDVAGNRTSQSATITIDTSAPPPPPPSTNLLKNPSLETDTDGNQVPDCWKRDGYGTNTSTYTLVTDAFDGGRAQRIDMTSYTSGGRRLASAQDSGACAPAATPGHRYTMTAYYKSTVQPRLSVFYRNTSGVWSWFAESTLLPASSTYRQATFTTPALPSNATAISIGVTLVSVGSLTTDAYTLVDIDATTQPPPPPPADTTPPSLSIACNGAPCSATAYASAVQVSLSASDASGIAEIRYTTNGSDPVNGTVYAAPFSVTASTTVRATALDNAGNRTSQSVSIVIGTQPPPPPPPTNLLQNASFELDANGDQVPDCWKRDGYGTNTATYTLVGDAFDGAIAQRLDITSWTNGGRRLASAQDAGACAPSVTPGRTYTVTAYYKATVAPKMSVFYRNASGTWSWLAESAPLPTSSTYRPVTYTTPPMPADATAISVGLSIFNVGSLTSDAYTLIGN